MRLTIDRHPWGPRVYLVARTRRVRVHHGPAATGAALLALALDRRAIALGLLALAAHDARDFPFRDCDNHRPKVRTV